MKAFSLILLFALLFFTSCRNTDDENTISISGAFALYPLVVKWAEEYSKLHPEIRFDIQAGGAGKGIVDALTQTVDLGMVSRDIAPEEINNGAWFIAVTRDAVLPTVNKDNPVFEQLMKRGVTKNEFRDIFINEKITNWGEVVGENVYHKINLYTRSDACGAADIWSLFLGGKQEDLKGVGIFGDPGLAEAVEKDKLGIGFNNTIFIYDINTGKKRNNLEVIPIDLNENGVIDIDERFYGSFQSILDAIAKGHYPSPPARDLFLVSKGQPVKQATRDFIEWILTGGQVYVTSAGYVPLMENQIQSELKKLK